MKTKFTPPIRTTARAEAGQASPLPRRAVSDGAASTFGASPFGVAFNALRPLIA